MEIVSNLPKYIVDFVHHLGMLHMVMGVVIALFFGVATGSVIGLFLAPILAAIVYIAADAVVPSLMHHTPLVMPHFDKALLQEALALYVVFFVMILIVFAVKKVFLAATR
ncbi:MAG: hypothetical protein KGM97_05350 [Alphaproteobacteria bacterium]|nr:hypothetical protein [Alphaproteobacteria bacterium]MDE2630398.1 hypothetical protein [Alphaproteobacteria bacterium]